MFSLGMSVMVLLRFFEVYWRDFRQGNEDNALIIRLKYPSNIFHSLLTLNLFNLQLFKQLSLLI